MATKPEYDYHAIKAPLHLTAEQRRILWEWTDFLLDVNDAAVIQRHQYYHIHNWRKDHSIPKKERGPRENRWYLTYSDQQDEVKDIRREFGIKRGYGNIPDSPIAAKLKDKEHAFKRFTKAIITQQANNEDGKWEYIEPPKPKGDAMRANPDWRRSMNFRNHMDTMQKNIIRSANNPAFVNFNIPNLGTAKYRTDRNLPADAKLVDVCISVEDGKWWVAVKYKTPKKVSNLQVTRPEDVPNLKGLTNKQIFDLVDTSVVRAAGGDQGVTNNWALSDKTYRKKFNLNSAQQARKYFLWLDVKHYAAQLSHRRKLHGDDAPNYKNYQKILKKKRAAMRKIVAIDDNRRYQTAAYINKTYDVFVAEKLDSKDMLEKMPNKNNTRRMAETGFGRMLSILQHKMGDRLILVDPRNTSREDSFCGHVHKNNRYGERFRCKGCGRTANADYNASINIMAKGIVAEPTKFVFKKMSASDPKG